MTFASRIAGLLALAALAGCSDDAKQPLDRHIAALQPDTVSPLPQLDWPAGTLLCPMTPYQSSLQPGTPEAERVNAFMKRKQFLGDEGHWSLVVIAPSTIGVEGIEHLRFKQDNYDVVTGAEMLARVAPTLPAGFIQQQCVPVEQGRVFVVRSPSRRRTVAFGVAAD